VDWLDLEEYPFAAHHRELPMGRMHFVDEGSGPPVVMVHGNPAWSFIYRRLIRRLAPTHRCVAPDHIGFGLSDKPAGWTYRPVDHARNLEALIEGLGLEGITLIVHDWGGPIGLSYAVAHPENVAGLVILNTWMWPVDDDRHFIAFSRLMGGRPGRFLIRCGNLFARVVVPRSYGDRRRLTRDVHRHYLRPLGTPVERTACSILPGEILGSTGWLRGLWERRSALADIPTLIVWGMEDIAFREKELRRWSEVFDGARVMRLPGVGHDIQEEAPDELGDAVADFLIASR
jgi:haloalkane dehalogenase